MIDTESIQQYIPSDKLQLIALDIKHIRKINLEHVKKELINYQNSDVSSAYIRVGLNDSQEIIIEGTQTLLGEKRIDYFNLVNNNRSIDEMAKLLITNYTNFLRQQYRYQTNISDANLHKLLDKNPRAALFEAIDLANYLIDNLDHISGFLLRDLKDRTDDSLYYDYFIPGIVIKLNEINSIKSSTFNIITKLMQDDDIELSFKINIMTNLYNIIIHNNQKFQITFDEPIDYVYFIKRLPKKITNKQIEMPLAALPNLAVKMTGMKNIKFKIFSQQDLSVFIDNLLSLSDIVTVKHMIDLGLDIELSANDKTTISKMLQTINDTFSQSNKLQDVATILKMIIA